MVWTATLADVSGSAGTWIYKIVYADGTRKFDRAYTADNLTDAVVQQTARDEITRLTVVRASVGKLRLPVGGQINLAPPPTPTPKPTPIPPAPTPGEIAQAQFFADLNALRQLQRAVAIGVVSAGDLRIIDAQNAVVAKWLDSYLSLL